MSVATPALTREVQPADIAAVLGIMALGAPGLHPWSPASIESEIAAAASFAARNSSGEIEAFIFMRDVADAFEISYLATNLQVRQKGRMRHLLARAVDFARSSGRPIWLDVHELNEPAVALYKAAGFKQTGRRPKYYADGGAAILYTLGSALG